MSDEVDDDVNSDDDYAGSGGGGTVRGNDNDDSSDNEPSDLESTPLLHTAASSKLAQQYALASCCSSWREFHVCDTCVLSLLIKYFVSVARLRRIVEVT